MTRLSLLPPPFVHRMLTAFGQDSHALKEARALLKSILTTAPVTSFRRNPLKTNIHTYMGDGIIVAVNNLNSAIPTCTTPTTTATTTPIPWFPSLGRFASPRPNYALDPLFYAGAIYPQDASSMLFQRAIPHLHQQQQQQLQYQPITKILDLCSAPGGKSGVMASMSSPLSTVIVSNELVSNRASILEENLAKGAFPSSIVTQNRSVDFLDAGLQEYFDVVVVDAPCSGEGLFRKEIGRKGEKGDAIKNWTPKLVRNLSLLQRQLIDDAARLVRVVKKSGQVDNEVILKDNSPVILPGILVYMTCTFEKEENEAVVESLWQRHGDKIAPRGIPDIDPSWGLVTVNIDISAYSSKHSHHPVYYCYPHRFQGEGMFIALFDVCDHLSSSNSTSEFISQKKTKKNKNQKSSSSSALSSSTDLSTSLTLPTSSSTDFFKHRERPSKIIPSLVIQNIRSTCAKEAQLAAPFVNLNPTIDTNHFNYQSTTSNPSALPQQLLAIPSILFVSETHMSKKAAAAQLSSSSSRGRSNSESSLTTSNLNLHIIPEALSETMLQLASKPGLSIRKWGVHAGEIISSTSSTNSLTNSYKKSSSSRFSPSSELPVSLFAPNSSSSPSTSNLLNIQLSKEQALLYVQGKQFSPNIAITHSLNNSTNSWITTHETGWALVSYLGLNLGWCRVVVGGERVNIHYPKSWRPKRSLWEID